MHHNLVTLVNRKLDEASTFITKHMPISLPVDMIYEGLVGEPHVVQAFSEAVKYMPPNALNRRVPLKVGTQELIVTLRFPPTATYPVFLIPKYDLQVTQESELGQSLEMAIQVATDWNKLIATWGKFCELNLDAHTMAFLFPWIREIMLDYDVFTDGVKLKREREKIDCELRAIQRRFPPKRFPSLSAELNQLCLSGKRLFGQYRMLEAAIKTEDLNAAPISIDHIRNSLIPMWVQEHIKEAIEDWREAKQKREEQEKQAALARLDDGDDSTKLRRVRR